MTKARDTANIVGGGFSGTIAGATMEPTGDTAAGDNAAIGFTAAEGLILTGQGSTSDITLKNDADAVVFTVPTGTDDILFPDNAKAMFGAGSDLQIYHDVNNSNIRESGTGNLQIWGNNTVFYNSSGDEIHAQFITDGAVELRHNNAVKIATTATGVDVTGAITVGGAALVGGSMVYLASSGVISDAASVVFTQFDATKYDHYQFWTQNIVPVTDNAAFYGYTSTDGGSNYDTGGSDYVRIGTTTASANGYIIGSVGSASGETGITFAIGLHNPHTATKTICTAFAGGAQSSTGTVSDNTAGQFGFYRDATADVDAIKFAFSSGNIESGEIVMYGIANGT